MANLNSFDDLDLDSDLLRGVNAYGVDRPTDEQLNALWPCLQGGCDHTSTRADHQLHLGKDVLIQAKSGMGKTLVFTIALLQKVNTAIKWSQVIVLSPTRELAEQNYKVMKKVAQFMQVKCHLAIGGKWLSNDVQALAQCCHVLVCTVGRLHQLISEKILYTAELKLVVMDEFDKMLCQHVNKSVEDFTKLQQIINMVKWKKLQKIFVSATANDRAIKEAKKYMTSPIVPSIKPEELTLEGIAQYYTVTDTKSKTLEMLITSMLKADGQGLVFCNFKHTVDEIENRMNSKTTKVGYIHADMGQSVRNEMMKKLKSRRIRVLVTSDLLCRGIDVQQIKFVVNYDLPKCDKQDYIHRIGRSGRYGRKGIAFTLVSEQEVAMVTKLQKYYDTELTPVSDCTNFYQDYN